MLGSDAAEAVCAAALVATLGFAVVRPRGLPEAVVALPAGGIVVATGAVSTAHAADEAARLGPVLGFLAAILVLAGLCEREGLFRAIGDRLAGIGGGRPGLLLPAVFVVAAFTTATLSLDATVVLLTPVIFATAVRLRLRPKPHVYACTHLANTGSLLLPVSNLTNLLAYGVAGLTFTRFAALMALPWVLAIGAEYLTFRLVFATDLSAVGELAAPPWDGSPARSPRVALVVLALTLIGFVVSSFAGVNPAWAAGAGALVLAVRAVHRRRASPAFVARSASVPFCGFVLSLGIIVRGLDDHGLQAGLRQLVPAGSSLPALLAIAALAAVLANLLNNLPAVLVLLPVVAAGGAGPVLAALVGVNIGPNLTYTGSLATLLWRRSMASHGHPAALREFVRLGALTVPVALVLAVVGLWAGLRLIGT